MDDDDDDDDQNPAGFLNMINPQIGQLGAGRVKTLSRISVIEMMTGPADVRCEKVTPTCRLGSVMSSPREREWSGGSRSCQCSTVYYSAV